MTGQVATLTRSRSRPLWRFGLVVCDWRLRFILTLSLFHKVLSLSRLSPAHPLTHNLLGVVWRLVAADGADGTVCV